MPLWLGLLCTVLMCAGVGTLLELAHRRATEEERRP